MNSFPVREKTAEKAMERGIEENEEKRFNGLENIIIAAACVIAAIICTYVIYSAM